MPAASTSLARDLRSMRTAFRQIDRSFTRLVETLATATPGAVVQRPRRKLKLSPARKAALQLQGQYVGHMRGLGPIQKAKIKKIRAAKGIRAAIVAAKKAAG